MDYTFKNDIYKQNIADPNTNYQINVIIIILIIMYYYYTLYTFRHRQTGKKWHAVLMVVNVFTDYYLDSMYISKYKFQMNRSHRKTHWAAHTRVSP